MSSQREQQQQQVPSQPPQQRHPFDIMYQNYTPSIIAPPRPAPATPLTTNNSVERVSGRAPDVNSSVNFTRHDPPGRRWSKEYAMTESPTPTPTPTPPLTKQTEEMSPSMRPDLSMLLNDPKPDLMEVPEANSVSDETAVLEEVEEEEEVQEEVDLVPVTTEEDDSNSIDKENSPVDDTAMFLASIRKEFRHHPDVYSSFVDIMRLTRTQNMPFSEAVGRVQKILHGKQDLIAAFNSLLPADYRIADLPDDDENMEQSSSPIGTPGPAPLTSAFHFINLLKSRFADQPEIYNKFTQLLESYSCKKINLVTIHSEVRNLLAGDLYLLGEFNHFMPLPDQPMVLGRRHSNDRDLVNQQSKKHKTYFGQPKLPVGWETTILFTRIRKLLGNEITYNDFLKLIGLFNQGVLDIGTTVRMASEYLKSDGPLLKEFKTFVGYVELREVSETRSMNGTETVITGHREKSETRDQSPVSSVRGTTSAPDVLQPTNSHVRQTSASTQRSFGSKSAHTSSTRKITLYELATRRSSIQSATATGPFDDDTQCASSLSGSHTASEFGPGPSYRRIPKSAKSKCSGRDILCNEALNDEYASHPIWASEDGGFVASKKNQYEEALHRFEDERYYEDRCIDSGVNTIGLLQQIQDYMDTLSASQLSSYRPQKHLGGGTEMVYKPALTKIYDKKLVGETIYQLHNNPVQSVPNVLKKLTTKVEEWKQKKIQADKSRKMTETENFYKALDSRSNTFKQIDKKTLLPKSLISEIEAISYEQQDTGSNKARRNTGPQISFDFKDLDIITDVIRVLGVFNKHHIIYSQTVKDTMEQFFSSFVLPLLKVEGFEPILTDDPDTLPCTADGVFVNDGLYCFFRIFQIAYERLEIAKTISQQYCINPKKTKQAISAQMDITTNRVKHHGIDLDFRNGCYPIMLDLIERLLKGDIDQGTYEACTRYMFGLKAYVLFTFDKVLDALSNQVYQGVTEPNCRSLVDLYIQEDTRVPEENLSSLQLYKVKAESIRKGNEHLYMILSTLGAAGGTTLSISMLGNDDDDEDFKDYMGYVEAFTDWETMNPSVDTSNMTSRFLQRNVRKVRAAHRNTDQVLYSGHEYKICQNTYKLFYVIDKEDYFQRSR
ncbi:hypothetical protein BJV82DRAFT_598310 [Fennellomyces sp. T-0311]|nr:hypothetical protein BJV82DRAFT_598310 [Fennellomyces sp. T-0311]